MAIVSHAHEFIFLKTRKTAGSSVEVWLAPKLDPERDLAALTADLRLFQPGLAGKFKAGGLTGHATAERVLGLVGQDIWRRYFKMSIERDPWDRVISLWSWRQKHRGMDIRLDDFLSAMESGDPEIEKRFHAEQWSNWPIYAIGEQIVADQVVQYSALEEGLEQAFSTVGIALNKGELPRVKAGLRGPDETVTMLTAEQKRRIGRLFSREIEAFGYRSP